MDVKHSLFLPLAAVMMSLLSDSVCDLSGDLLLYERQRYDGWYNNMANPDWGSVDSRLARKTPAHYEDGVYMMAETNRPSPRQLSQAFMKGSDGQGSRRNRTTMLAFFGQVVTSEILMASEMQSCPIEVTKIPISRCDDNYDKECKGESTMPFYRAQYDTRTGQSPNMPREQVSVSLYHQTNFVLSIS